MRRVAVLAFLFYAPVILLAESAMPGIRFTGAPTDGGQNCSTCHNSFGAANSDTTGSLAVTVADYNPGVQQLIHVTLQHPKATRWGFQITIRQVSDETKQAGTFTAGGFVTSRCDDGTHFGSPAPCGGSREFGEHLDAPRTGGGAGFDFMVPWMPPANEVGDLRVYVSAVAADGDNSALGDRVYTVVKTISFTGACSLTTRPTLRSATNGASFLPAFSSNAMISIFGLDFQVNGRTRGVGLGDITSAGFPTVLGCVSVQVSGPGLPQPVLLPIAYVQTDQINAQAPAFVGTGPVMLTVILNPGRGNELRSDVATLSGQQAFAPAFFVFPPTMSIAALFANTSVTVANPAVVPGGVPAKPGDFVSLFGTGFGDTNPAVATGQLDVGEARLTNPITVKIGGVALSADDVPYAGLSPGSIGGLYQINVRIPAGTPNGDIPVSISIGGFTTQPGATIAVQSP